jgi:hypothetical protein
VHEEKQEKNRGQAIYEFKRWRRLMEGPFLAGPF